ncbi:MerR family transcriptional regulator [Candidatus Binatia bacterium]|nr:MerR family transcriptional regulator [Candidatus Binatia bacterium]
MAREAAGPANRVAVHDAFPLRTVAAMTGLTPDIIRAWEKRYAVVSPVRGARGARLYSADDIAHLRLLARVVRAGRAIGDVAVLSRGEIERLAVPPTSGEHGVEARATPLPRDEFVDRVMERLERFDHAAVARLLGDAVVGLGMRRFVYEVVLPLVRRVGICWADGTTSIAQEHLLTGMLRNLLAGLIQGRAVHGTPIVLATPAGERHEIGLLLVALLAQDAGLNVVYLGADLPAVDVVTAVKRVRARVLGLSLITPENRARAIGEIAQIQAALPDRVELWLGGADAPAVAAGVKPGRGLVLDCLATTETEMTRVALAPPAMAGPREEEP